MKAILQSLKDNNAHIPVIFFTLFFGPLLLVSVNETLAVISALISGAILIASCIVCEID